ncbi:hypothetical protein FQN50_005841 [Emmonsiellopsis sp. PD_5]|nr:hypothetical protein FQN50_005841 [Emmonsiellopsis sp. PD_5]
MKIAYILIALTSVLAAAAPADDAAEYAATAELAANLGESDMTLSNAADAALRPCGGLTPGQCRAACEAAKRGCPGAPERRSVRLEGKMFGHWFGMYWTAFVSKFGLHSRVRSFLLRAGAHGTCG